jgi:hypothetical protein
MREPGLQGDGKNEATVTSTLTLMPLVIANKQRAPVAAAIPLRDVDGSVRRMRDGGARSAAAEM